MLPLERQSASPAGTRRTKVGSLARAVSCWQLKGSALSVSLGQ